MPDSADAAPKPRITPAGAALLAAILVISVGFIGYSLLRENPEKANAAKVPPVAAGLVELGSDLRAIDGVATSTCDGEPFTTTSPTCSVAQSALSRRTTIVPKDGVLRAWTVRGAAGELTLQVLRANGSRISEVARSSTQQVPSTGPHRFETELAIRTGDIVALALGQGAGIGMRPAPQAVIARWEAPVGNDTGAGLPGMRREMLLRTELDPR